jgi:hypothetical protein
MTRATIGSWTTGRGSRPVDLAGAIVFATKGRLDEALVH